MTLTARRRAERSAQEMWSQDGASSWIGMTLDAVDEGTAQMSLRVAAHHCNGHGMCHGGITFALADSTFAFACNSRNRRAVAQHNTITYTRPAFETDTLVATAREVALTGRSGVYDVRVVNQKGETVAEFRGLSRLIDGQHFEEKGGEVE